MQVLSRVWQSIRWFFRRFQVIRWLILLGLTVILIFSAWFTYKAKTADVQNIKSTLQTKTVIYDANNEEAGTLYGQKGTYVELSAISPQVQNAVISTEDRTFYSNGGFSIKGILRSALNYVIHHGQIMGGGSTITQQLAKNTLLTQKQTMLRKAQELFMAIQLNKVYSKQDILAMYLNNAYFGNGVWGVQDAAKRYFGKNASQLDASEGAILAGMLRNPSYYNPADHKDNAISRRNVVLQLMVDNHKLTQAQANAAKAQSVQVVDAFSNANAQKYPSYFDSVIEEARSEGISVDDILNKGYKIYTNLDQTYQQNLQTSFEQDWAFPANAADGKQVQGASIILDPKTGGVRAVVGNRGEHTFLGFNYATQLRYNSLAEETYEKYGERIFGKTIYIMGNSYEMSDFTARTFFKVFDKDRLAEGTKVEFIDSIRDIGLVDEDMLVLREDPEHNGFQDITDFVRELKLKVDYGYYQDGWMDEHASLTVMAGKDGTIHLEVMYPGIMNGGEMITITKDEDEPLQLPVQSSVVDATLTADPWQMVHLTFDYNFYMQNAQEQRGKDRLAAIVHILAD